MKKTRVRILSNHLGWILEAFAKESASAIGVDISMLILAVSRRDYLNWTLWKSRFKSIRKPIKQVFIHHEALLRFKGDLTKFDSRVVLTHFDSDVTVSKPLMQKLKTMQVVVVQNEFVKKRLLLLGIDEARIRVGCGAVDRSIYFPSASCPERVYVIIVGECKQRKNPQLVSEVILANPQINFLIHGNGWEEYLPKVTLEASNLCIIPFSLRMNPELIRSASLLLSLSKLEGGPIPLLEALASGTPVLATDTGFAREVVMNCSGVVVSSDVDASGVSRHLISLITLKSKVWSFDLLYGKYTWEDLGRAIYE